MWRIRSFVLHFFKEYKNVAFKKQRFQAIKNPGCGGRGYHCEDDHKTKYDRPIRYCLFYDVLRNLATFF